MQTVRTLALLWVVPYGLIAVAGFLLWRRCRSLPTLIAALGFGITLIGQFVIVSFAFGLSLFATIQWIASTPIPHFTSLGFYLLRLGVLALWIGAAGLLWHSTRRQ
jgi:hypothetical protein